MPTYVLSGLVVDSGAVIEGAVESTEATDPDLTVVLAGERAVPRAIADGTLLQAVTWNDEMQYSTVGFGDGSVLLRLHGLVDFLIDAKSTHVRAWSDPACEPEMLGILVAGNLLAMVLALRGETVLHASAVEARGRAVAFVAHSGMGKSTLAALACHRGARFVTDDLLRIDVIEGAARCWTGSSESRLRRAVGDIVGGDGLVTRTSVDGRVVWRPEPTATDKPELVAVVLPVLEDPGSELGVERLGPGRALVDLTRTPRILGWIDPQIRMQSFANLSRLVRSVPVLVAHLPWGPPFEPAMIESLLAAAGAPLNGRDTPPPAA